MVTVEDWERYSLELEKERQEDEKITARQLSSRAYGGGDNEPLPEKPTRTEKRKRAEEESLAHDQLWRAQQQAVPLSDLEQAEYLALLSRYQNRSNFTPTAAELVEVQRLSELKVRVSAQQKEFAQRWPQLPGVRPERLTDGVASWSQAQQAKVLKGCAERAWKKHERQQVALLPDTPVQPGLLGHVLHKAGVLVEPKPGCKLLLLPSEPGVAAGEEEWRECPRPDGESLLVSHGADIILDLDTLLLDWHGWPWLLPLHITEGGRVCLGSVLPTGVHREANRRFCNWLLEQWVQHQQQGRLEGQASGLFKGHHGGTLKEEEGATSPASFKAPHEDEAMEVADGLNEMDCLSVSSSSGSADLIIDEEGGSSSPRGGGIVTDDDEKEAEAKAQAKEDTGAPAAAQDGGAWSVDLWELAPGGKRLLLQHQAWKCVTDDEESKLCTMMAKPEYQSPLGGEQWSARERAEQDARLLLFPALLKVRVDVPSNEVLLVEQVERQLGDDNSDRLRDLFGPVAALLEQLEGLPPGPYLLSHSAGETRAKLLRPSQSGEGGDLDLHPDLTRLFRPAVVPRKRGMKGAPPLDPDVVFPHHFKCGRVPMCECASQ